MANASDSSAVPATSRSRLMQRTWGGILWLLVLVSLLVMWGTKKAPQSPALSGQAAIVMEVDGEVKPVKLVTRKVAPFAFTERSEREISREDLLGKPWVVNFIFTSCVMSCPANTTAMMKLAQQSKDLDVRFVTITVDPERDTPERLRDYAEIYGADPEKWLFLTGDKQKIHDLILRNFLQAVEEKQGENRLLGYEFAHSDRFMHIAADGTILGQYLSTDPKEMVKLRRVLAGETETPEANRFLVAAIGDDAVDVEEPESTSVEQELPQQPADQTTPEDSSAETDRAGESATDSAEPSENGPAAEISLPLVEPPAWLLRLPAVNALLNSLATLLLVMGFGFIKIRNPSAHKFCMISAFLVSIVFLTTYLTYHFGLHYYTGESSKKFPDLGFIRQVYLVILISHILLAVAVPVLAVGTLYQAWKQNWERHKTWARITFPIWLYVSVTGVVIYVMLYLVI